MGLNLCIANESAREQAKLLYCDEDLEDEDSEEDDDLFYDNIASLERHFSSALMREDGQLGKGLTKDEIVSRLNPNIVHLSATRPISSFTNVSMLVSISAGGVAEE